jgi:OOP family OmpA-OmpF porin
MMLKTLNKKHILAAAIAGVAGMWIATANAAISGQPYIGGELGVGNVHQGGFSQADLTAAAPGTIVASGNSARDTGLAGRIFGGYQFNQNFAAEMGYTKFSTANAKSYATTVSTTGSTNLKSSIRTDALDLVGKGILPLEYGFNVYGKLGLAYLRTQGSSTTTTTTTGFGSTTTSSTTSNNAHHIYPTFGAGVGYDITKNITTDVSWNHIQKVGGSNKLANTDLFGVGLTYNFG